MPGDKPGQSRRPAWKAAADGPARQGPRFGWKPEGPTERRPNRRLRQLFIGLGAVACVAAIVVIVKMLQPPPHAGLVLFGADPAADVDRLDVPPDVYGWQGGRQLAQWATDVAANHQSRWGKLTPEVLGDAPVSLQAKDFATWADRLAGETKLDPLVVVFGMHGGAGPDGPYLFTAGGERLALRTVIDTFAGSRFKGRQVVLVLDPARLMPDPALGLLHNDCVRSLRALEPAVKDAASKLIVLCASAPGQRSWDSEEWRASAFTRALLNGLRGAAARAGQTTITAWDLFEYVQRQTETWTATNRPTRQTPLMMPDPDAGGRARAESIAVAIKVGDAPPTDPKEAPGARFRAPDDLLKHWQEWQKLDASVPSPAVYTPRLWRRYRELLLRYEHLVRADEKAAAAKLAQVLRNAGLELEDALALRRDSASAGNVLPLSAAFGFTDVTAFADQARKFQSVWSARTRTAERDKLLLDLRQEAGASADAQRLRLTSYLLQQASDPTGTQDELTEGADVLRQVYTNDPRAVRPAEAHFLLMLRAFDWGAQKPPPDLLRRAVAIRLWAERAALGLRPVSGAGTYPYSEQVWPVVQAAVTTADGQRRNGEDLLFTNAERWPESRTQLEAAETAYKTALNTAQQLQEALATRDRALAELPFLTQWASAQRPDEVRAIDLVALWDKVHDLDARLNDLVQQSGKAPDASRLSTATAAVRGPLQELSDKFQEQSRSAIDFSILQTNWQRVEHLLTVPLVEPALRVRLVERSREMSAKFNEEKGNPADAASPAGDELARDRAQRQGLLALAVLGNALIDAQANTNLRKADAIRDQLTDLGGTWEDAVNRAGDQLGRHWQALADPAADEARSRYTVAFSPPAGLDPALVQRRLRWQVLLVGLARRTGLDHWYAENGDAYYRQAARNFLTDADALVPPSTDGRKQVLPGRAEVDQLINAPALTLSAPEMIDWTSEPSRTLEYSVTAPPVLKGDGFVALWPQVPPGIVTARPEDTRREGVAVVATDAGAAKRFVLLNAPLSATAVPPLRVTLEGYYRGQRPRGETLVALERTPVRILSQIPPPTSAGFAVRADKSFRGAVAIVLDYSGSMNELGAAQPNQPRESKLKQAQRVVRGVLQDLPPDTQLSVRIYGHKKPPDSVIAGLRNDDEVYRVWTRATEDELIFKGTVNWGPRNTDPLDKLVKDLDKPAQAGTPLVRTMNKAKNDLPQNFAGPRTLLVLTDGADTMYGNSSPKDRQVNPEVISRVRQEFKNNFAAEENITVQMVVFSGDDKEWASAQQQFGEVVDFALPGSVERAENPAALAEKLVLALRPKLRLLTLSGEPVPGLPRLGQPAHGADDPLNRLRGSAPVPPGLYRGYMYGSRQQISFDRGDRLLIRLLNATDGIRFERDLLALTEKLWEGRYKQEGDWVLGVPQVHDDETNRGRRLKMMTTLETTKGRSPGRDGVLQQTTPRSVWWDVAPGGATGAKAGTLRVKPLFGYPAPAWDVTVDDWPADPELRPVRVSAWCRGDLPPVARRISIVPGSPPLPVEVDGQSFTVSVTLESQPLYTGAGPSEAQPPAVSCLVVRVRHATPGHPIQVQLGDLPGVPKPAEEHRYYGTVNYTALFGPLTADQVRDKALDLDLVSVNSLKAAATGITFDLPPPSRSQQRPQPLRLEGEDR